jgi:cell division protein FtsQ
MKLHLKIRNEAKLVLLTLAAIISVAVVNVKESSRICKEVHISIINPEFSNFVAEDEVRALVTGDQAVPVVGSPYSRIVLKEIEKRAESNTYIQEAQAFKDHKGNLLVDIYIAKPIARIIRQGKKDLYISDQGNLIETTARYTTRVILISGAFADNLSENLKKDAAHRKLFEFLVHINGDPFWKAQISQLHIDSDGDIILYPQVTRQFVQFGKVDGWEAKLFKLRVFYDKILPFKGWNTYTKVNLEYDNQIICE